VASGRRLIALACLIAARTAFGADPCDEERTATGLGVAVQAGAVVVGDVAPESAGARAGFRAGDVIVQANDVVPRTCSQWVRAIGGANKALLVLVRRGDVEVPLALVAAVWRPAGVAGAPGQPPAPGTPPAESRPGAPAPPSAPVAAPARTAPPPPPPPLPADTAVSVDGVLRDLAALAPVVHARREIETLAARNAAPPDVVGELRSVARYYEGAVVAWDAIEGDREQDRRTRRLPVPNSLAVPYFSDSPVASLLDEFSFLEATIARQPRGISLAEASGTWRPVWARLLLWERGGQALDALRDRFGAR
jgi:PDZ domain